MPGLIPLMLAVVIAEAATQLAVPLAPLASWRERLIVVGLTLIAWLLTGEIAARLVARSGSRRWLMRWELLAQVLILVGYAWICLGWGWSAAPPRLFTLALAPWIALQSIHWWTSTVAVRQVTGNQWSRAGRVLYRLRFGVMPMMLILPFFDVGAWIAQRWDLESTWFAGGWGALRATYCAQLFMGVVMVLMPLALLPLWGVSPLPADAITTRLADCCRRTGVAVAGLMCWPESGSRIYNAMVIGVAPRLRYVLFSKDLMRDMPEDQIEAVLGHELGHARHGHLWTYFLYFNVAFLVAMLGEPVITRLLLPPIMAGSSLLHLSVNAVQIETVVGVIGMLLVVGVLWRVGFGVLSRACERQADLAGAELAGDPRVMGAALRSVARLSGQPETEPSWCHHSIAQRVAFMERVAEQPAEAACHHRLVRTMWRALAALFVALLLLALWLTFPGNSQFGLPTTKFRPGSLGLMIPDHQWSAA